MLMTTTPTLEGKRIREYHGVVSGAAIITTTGTIPASPAHRRARRSGAAATAVTAASSPSVTTR